MVEDVGLGKLIQDLKHEDSWIRKNAVLSLADSGDKRAVEPLVESLKDKVGFVSKGAAIALDKIGEPAVDPLIQFFNSEELEMRKLAAIALGETGDDRAVGVINQLLDEEDVDAQKVGKKVIKKTKKAEKSK